MSRAVILPLFLAGLSLPLTAQEKPQAPAARPENVVFPKDAGHVDIRQAYGAKGDGVTDDTAALQKAFSEHLDFHSRILYLSNGTYLVSATLISRLPNGTPTFGTKLQGQSTEKTVIRLKDGCPGFDDPQKPRPVIKLCSRNQLDGGNMGHKNSIFHLTIDTGKGNPGAVGVDYLASNTGTIRDVLIRSGDGAGVCGIDMTKPWPGPCLIKNVRVEGFDHAILTKHSEYSVTFENVFVTRQRKGGFRNDGNILCLRRIQSLNAVPAIESKGMLILLDSELKGGVPGTTAVKSAGLTYLRNVRAAGYDGVLQAGQAAIGEYVSGTPKSLFPSPPGSLKLPIEETPEVPYDPPEQWARGGNGPATQKAIDSGSPTVYIPFGEYRIEKPIIIRGNVRRIHAMGSNVFPAKGMEDKPLWRYEGTAHKAVVLEWMDGGMIEHASPNALVMRHMVHVTQSNTPNCGPLFIEDVCAGPWTFENPQKIWARHLNVECEPFDVRNLGATLWVLGFKSERPGLQFETRKGGWTEVLGGFVYPCKRVPEDRPMFVNHESNFSAMLRQTSYIPGGIHRIKVEETRDGVTQTLLDLGETLYAGYRAPPPRGGEAAAPARKEEPAARKPADPATVAAWDAKLLARIREELQAGRKPRFKWSAIGDWADIVEVGPKDELRIQGKDGGASVAWASVPLPDRRAVAVAAARKDRAEDHALAAFYLLALGEEERAQAFLEKAGSAADEVRAAFR
jgi:hypothetical protein